MIGEKTSGLVLGGRKHRLPGGGYVKVTELDFIGLDGRRLEGVGVTPDLVVPLTHAALRSGQDPALDAAIAWLRDRYPLNELKVLPLGSLSVSLIR